jgi:hypothetical protein
MVIWERCLAIDDRIIVADPASYHFDSHCLHHPRGFASNELLFHDHTSDDGSMTQLRKFYLALVILAWPLPLPANA